ncbi:alcohol dehydrogenase catalytic domain-containing protein [Sulfolobus tengchongensis]|uniref:Alcohol dehydrogenase catalytic domain-containing protein n=1 Tax=Sulfolobus tengchongensis TaxID=207809 RepID=A0AAX4L593_9CREN
MKALVFDKSGIENLKVKEIEEPKLGPHDVLIRVVKSGLNPIDYFVVNYIPVKPMPHIPGAEIAGVVEKVGEHVKGLNKGDKVVVYNRVFDGSCDLCLSGKEMLCRNGGIMSVVTNGGWSEYFSVPDKNVFKIPENMNWDLAASLPVAALTSYHALRELEINPNDIVVVFGASGNTGIFAVELAKKFGATVIAVSRKNWLKEIGADYVVGYNEVVEKVKDITSGKMANIVINSLGSSVWDKSLEVLGYDGKLAFFGTLTGGEVKVNLSSLYGKHIKLVGTTGGSRKELMELINLCKDCKVKVWKTYSLEEGAEAVKQIMSENRDGRIMLQISSQH